jgi:hypothetical protein
MNLTGQIISQNENYLKSAVPHFRCIYGGVCFIRAYGVELGFDVMKVAEYFV